MMQGTKEWLEFRKNKIGGSDAPIIMGKSPWKTPYQLWLYKMGIAENVITEQMRYGIDTEPRARDSFQETSGIMVRPDVIVSMQYPWMMASLDGINEEKTKIVEIKCCGKTDHNMAKNGEVPEKYTWQLVHQMIVCELEECYYYSYHRGDGICLTYRLDHGMAEELIEKEKEFLRYMEEFETPAMTDKDFVQRQDEEWKNLSRQWLDIHRKVQAMSAMEQTLRKELIAIAGQSSSMGSGIKLSKTVRRGTIDYKAAEKDLWINLDNYRKKSVEGWRLYDDGTA